MKKGKTIFILCLSVLLFTVLFFVHAGPKATLTVWSMNPINDDNPQYEYLRALVKNFERKNPDITINWVAITTNDYNDQVREAVANDRGPDIFQTWGGSALGRFAAAGKLLDLTEELSAVPAVDAAKSAMSYDGKLYGIAPFFSIAGLYINEGKFKELGLKVPVTVDELEKTADAFKAKGLQPFACGEKDKWPGLEPYMYLVNRYGGNIFGQVIMRKARFDSEPFLQAGLKIQKWVKKGYFGDKPLAEAYDPDALSLMYKGKAAMMIIGSWACGNFSDKKLTDQTIGFYPFPIITGGKGDKNDVMGMSNNSFVASISAASKKDTVVRFFTYAMSVEACRVETGQICSVPGVVAPSALTAQASGVFAKAKTIQYWWDQDLPPALTDPVNVTIQSFFSIDTDVKKALSKYEDLLVETWGPINKTSPLFMIVPMGFPGIGASVF